MVARTSKAKTPLCYVIAAALSSLVFLLTSCPAGLSPPVEAGNSVIYDINPTTGSLSFTVDLGSTPADLVLTISNPTNDSVTNPSIQARAPQFDAEDGSPRRDHPAVEEFRRNRPTFERGGAGIGTIAERSAAGITARGGASDSVGDTKTFNGVAISSSSPPGVPATNRLVREIGGKTLSIWVADDSWTAGGSKTYLVTDEMVTALADYFLKEGAANDITDWVTPLLGRPWGPHDFSNLITNDDSVTILLYDIDNDNAAPLDDGGVFGLFFSRDNYRRKNADGVPVVPNSNERVMFYLDSVMLGARDGDTWESDDWAPSEIVSTLAHEYQHMIHFYQKQVANGILASTSTWVEEMMSMMLEDLLSDKIKKSGPRGVDWNDGSGGELGILRGRLPRFNYFNDQSLVDWRGDSKEVLADYAVSYAFGAYLLRNYGGPELLGALMGNPNTVSPATASNQDIVLSALASLGYPMDYGDLLRRWAQAVLLSHRTDAPQGYRYNRGGYFVYPYAGLRYRLGSINLYNYEFWLSDDGSAVLQGPYLYSDSPAWAYDKQPDYSSYYYLVGSNLSGEIPIELRNIEPDRRIGVVIRR